LHYFSRRFVIDVFWSDEAGKKFSQEPALFIMEFMVKGHLGFKLWNIPLEEK